MSIRPPRPGRPAARRAGAPGACNRAEWPHRNLPLLLLQAREGVLAHFRPTLNAHGVTEQQWRVVRTLLEGGPLEPRHIGERCRISSASLAGVLARMDELGLVQRQRVAQDQRRVLVSATPRSRALAAAMAPAVAATYERLQQHLGTDYLQALYSGLDQLIARVAELPLADAPPHAASRRG